MAPPWSWHTSRFCDPLTLLPLSKRSRGSSPAGSANAGGNVCDELFENKTLRKHAVKVVTTVDKAVGLLKKLDKLIPILVDLGKTHVNYGVEPAHYEVVGEALLATLSDALGDGYTTEVHEAWAAVWDIVKTTMIGKNYDYMDATYAI